MNPSTLNAAINEAKRFIEKAEKVPVTQTWKDSIGVSHFYTRDTIESGKPAAVCKRASMDLSRILVDLRAGK